MTVNAKVPHCTKMKLLVAKTKEDSPETMLNRYLSIVWVPEGKEKGDVGDYYGLNFHDQGGRVRFSHGFITIKEWVHPTETNQEIIDKAFSMALYIEKSKIEMTRLISHPLLL